VETVEHQIPHVDDVGLLKRHYNVPARVTRTMVRNGDERFLSAARHRIPLKT